MLAPPDNQEATMRLEEIEISNTTERGTAAERIAERELERLGYRIVERNFRCSAGELDLVARDGETLVFVEVRSRRSDRFGSALEAVGRDKQRQVSRVAAIYLQLRKPKFDTCRFDVVGITGAQIDVVQDAWRLGM
jgi:putative endonuclease